MSALTFEDFQNFSKQQVEAATVIANTLSKGLQEIAAETAEYSKTSLTSGAVMTSGGDRRITFPSLDGVIPRSEPCRAFSMAASEPLS